MYRVYVEKLFWEGERKGKESEADQPVGVQGLEYIFVYCLSRDIPHTFLFKR